MLLIDDIDRGLLVGEDEAHFRVVTRLVDNTAPTDAKRALAQLCGAHDREHACLADRDTLRARGEHSHARAFLDEVEQRLVPRFRDA